MINQLLVEFYLSQWQSSAPQLKIQANTGPKVNRDSQAKVDPLMQLQKDLAEQFKLLTTVTIEMAHLQMQLKQINPAHKTASQCDQCLSEKMNLGGPGMPYLTGHKVSSANIYQSLKQGQESMLGQDEGQEDAYWL